MTIRKIMAFVVLTVAVLTLALVYLIRHGGFGEAARQGSSSPVCKIHEGEDTSGVVCDEARSRQDFPDR